MRQGYASENRDRTHALQRRRVLVHPDPDGDKCEDGLEEWTVEVHETGEHHTSPCDEAIILSVLQPNERYTLAISGSSRDGLCWSGTCAVTALPGLGIAECVDAVTDACEGDRDR